MDFSRALMKREIGYSRSFLYKLVEEKLRSLISNEWLFDHPGLIDLLYILLDLAQNTCCARVILEEIYSYTQSECDAKSIVFLVSRLLKKMHFPDGACVKYIIEEIKMNTRLPEQGITNVSVAEMKNPSEFVKFRDSVEYQPMFKAIIKYQIQSLISQLSRAGEESVLLTACTKDFAADDDVIGSELGQGFLQERFDFVAIFRDYCFIKTKERDFLSAENNKRKLCETNGEQNMEGSPNDEIEIPDGKKVKVERVSSPEAGSETRDNTAALPFSLDSPMFNPRLLGTSLSSPILNQASSNLMSSNLGSPNLGSPNLNSASSFKTQHKCSQCSYTSKFKANVVRHERSIHGINVEGAPGPTIQYACTLCTYKSLYRSNLMRHEKNVHKLEPVQQETDLSRLGMPVVGDQFPVVPGMPRVETSLQKEPDQSSSDSTSQTLKDTEDGERDNSGEGANGCHVCSYCQLVYPTMQQLKDHIDQAHYVSGKYDCGKCRTSFSNLVMFQAHMATHYLNRQEKCICGRTFQYRVSLLKHIPKCVVAKETNFKMSDVVLGSGVEMESAYNRLDSDQGLGRPEAELGFGVNYNEPRAGWHSSLAERSSDGEQDEKRQDLEQGFRLHVPGSKQEQDCRWQSEQGGDEAGLEAEQEQRGRTSKVFSMRDSEQENSEQESEQDRNVIRENSYDGSVNIRQSEHLKGQCS